MRKPFPTSEQDWTGGEPAAELARRIEAYWRERGYDVVCEITPIGFNRDLRMSRVDIRSNLVDGRPPESARIIAGGVVA